MLWGRSHARTLCSSRRRSPIPAEGWCTLSYGGGYVCHPQVLVPARPQAWRSLVLLVVPQAVLLEGLAGTPNCGVKRMRSHSPWTPKWLFRGPFPLCLMAGRWTEGGSYPPVPEQQPVPLFQLEAVRVPEEGTQGPRLWALLQPMSWGVGAALASPPRAADLEVKSPLPARTFSEAEDLCLRLCVPARLSRTAPEAAPSTRGPSAPFSEVVLGPSRPRHVRFGASCTPAGALGPGGARRGFREAERKSWCTGHVLSLELGASDHRGAHLAPQGGGSERRPRLSGPAVPGDAQCGCPPDCDAPSPGLVRPREVSQASGHSPRLSSNYGFAPSLSFWEEIC